MSVQTRQHRSAMLALFNLLMVVATTGVFAVCWYLFYRNTANQLFLQKGNWLVLFLGTHLYISFARLYDGFHVSNSRIQEIVYSQSVATLMTGFFMYLVLWLLKGYIVPPNPLPLLGACGCDILFSILWAYGAKHYAISSKEIQRTAIIYQNGESFHNGKTILAKLPMQHEVVFEADVTGISSHDIILELQEENVDVVMICGVPSSYRNDILKYCITNDIVCYARPTIGDSLMRGGTFLIRSHLPIVLCQKATPGLVYLFTKRFMDMLLSSIAIVLLSPLLVVTALCIKIYDHGPVFYNQTRLTQDGKLFKVHKFRSMKVNAESNGVARLATQNDDRITPVGRKIRALRIDELPQLFNILKGDMTIVGPRPERPEIAKQYCEEMPEFAMRLQVKAGLTGYAQVYGQYNTTPYDKLQMDLFYINNLSLVTDMKIIFATIKILFMKESTEGVADGSTTAMDTKEHE